MARVFAVQRNVDTWTDPRLRGDDGRCEVVCKSKVDVPSRLQIAPSRPIRLLNASETSARRAFRAHLNEMSDVVIARDDWISVRGPQLHEDARFLRLLSGSRAIEDRASVNDAPEA
jgi:hypothetical protein